MHWVPTKWPDATFTKWSVLADKTLALDCNWKVVDPAEVVTHSAKLAASSLSKANAFKNYKS